MVRRVSVVGNSGSGKTTLGRRLARRLDVPFLELDSIYHRAGWQPLPAEQFRHRVLEVMSADGWVIDGNYSAVRDLVWARADTVVWLDLPCSTVMRRVVIRTLRRSLGRIELWNGNREPVNALLRLDPNESIIRWSWTRHAIYRSRYAAASNDPEYDHLTFLRIGSHADVRRLLS
jgi:adenylate kinase family enzyme